MLGMLGKWAVALALVLVTFVFAYSTPPTSAHSGDVLSAAVIVTPTIDGTISTGEWDDAATITFDLVDFAGTRSTTLFVKNDEDFLFLAVLIHDDYKAWDTDPFKQGDAFNIFFDNDHDGGIWISGTAGDDAIVSKVELPTEDSFTFIFEDGGISFQTDSFGGGDNNVMSAFSHTNPSEGTIGDYTFEFRKELNSGDVAHDFILSAGNTVGVFLEYVDTPPGQNSGSLSTWPGPNECFSFQNNGIPCIGADIVIASSILPVEADHYLAYRANETKDTPQFSRLNVELSDQFESATYTVAQPFMLFNPVDKNQEGITDMVTHFVGYIIWGPHQTQTNVLVSNQFGEIQVDTIRPLFLMVPSSKNLDTQPPELEEITVDHYKCYAVAVTPDTPAFVPIQVQVSDPNFGEDKTFDVKRPRLLCNPVDKNGEGIIDVDTHQVCYDVRPAIGQPPHVKRNSVFTNNQFGAEQLDTQGERLLCVPSTKIPVNG